MDSKNFYFYRQNDDSLIVRLDTILKEFKYKDNRDVKGDFFEFISELLRIGAAHGFYGNLWHCYLAYIMVYHENVYSIDAELTGKVGGNIDDIALMDFRNLKEFFDFDLEGFSEKIGLDISDVLNFSDGDIKEKVFNKRIRDNICKLSADLANADSAADFQNLVLDFYKKYGVGNFGLHKAFRLDETGEIVPISRIRHVSLDDLVGLEEQKSRLCRNTQAFLNGKPANNCMLYGDSGTGKSTSIKAIANEYYEDGLRIIEIFKHEFKYINKVISTIKNRNYKFILYMDDLSFEEFEIEYKYLKAVIEGGLEKKPSNVLIYATSNRRHFIRETFGDNREYDELHKNDTKQEKTSLASRFGEAIYFGAPSPNEFKEIVLALRDRAGISISDEELLAQANIWEMHHHGKSGRSAQQFIDYLSGMENE